MENSRWGNNTTLLFLLAVFLAWPTFGISFLAFFGWIAWSGYSRAKNAEKREAFSLLLKPIFEYEHILGERAPEDGYSYFIDELGLPFKNGCSSDANDSYPTIAQKKTCGRLVMQFLAHNPREAATFVKAVRKIDSAGDSELGEVLMYESSDALKLNYEYYSSDIRLVCFRAIQALMTNNNLACFEWCDLERVSEMVKEMSDRQKAVAKNEARARRKPSGPARQEDL